MSTALAGVAAAASRLRAGCQTNAWRIQPERFESLLDVLDRIKGYGYRGFETGFRNVQGQFGRTREARAEIERRGLVFLGCHIFLLEYDPASLIAPAELVRQVLNGAADLGAERLILSGASARKAGVLDHDALKRKCDALNAAGRDCRSRGMVAAYHNHDKEFVHGGEEIEQMLRLTDAALVKLVMDAGHAVLAGADATAFVERHAGRIDGLHLRDFKARDAHHQVPLGEGTVDWKPLAAVIERKKWAGWLINEEERLNDGRPGDAAIGPARKHILRVFGV